MVIAEKLINRLLQIYRDVVVNAIAASGLIPYEVRYLIYRSNGIKIKSKGIAPGCRFVGNLNNIKIGHNSSINYDCFINGGGGLDIGDNTAIACKVTFISATHKIGSSKQRAGETVRQAIKVGNGCWIGAGAIIMPGVTIGDGCVIAAGSLVINDCEPDGLYAGLPAKRVKDI